MLHLVNIEYKVMSRIGKKYINVPDNVSIKLNGQKISINGPKGNLSRILPSFICCTIDQEEKKIFLEKAQETKLAQSTRPLGKIKIFFSSTYFLCV